MKKRRWLRLGLVLGFTVELSRVGLSYPIIRTEPDLTIKLVFLFRYEDPTFMYVSKPGD